MLFAEDNQFEYVQFGRQKASRISDRHFNMYWNCTTKNPYYYISFNKDLSMQIKGSYNYFKLRIDRYTGDIFFVFCNKKDQYALNARCSGNTITIYSKALLEYLIKELEIERKDYVKEEIRITDNLSKTDECIVVKIIK